MKRLHIYLSLGTLLAAILLQLPARAQFAGGNGRGEASIIFTRPAIPNRWALTQNNRVFTFASLTDAVAAGVVTLSNGPLPSTLQSVNRAALTTFGIQPAQPGIFAAALAKPNNQQLIKGDLRSIRIRTATGQSACTVQASYNQLLWLDCDRITANVTRCYTDKTLNTLFSSGDGTSWYNLENGGAVKINSSGLITEISCF